LRGAGLTIRTLMTTVLGFCLLAAALASRALSEALIEIGARFLDKDPTLTGRTYLWQRAADLIAEKPALGKGFHAFWQQGNLDAEGLWQFAVIDNRSGFNFHNTAIEILVHLGWVGLIVCAATLIIAAGFLIARYLTRPTLVTCFWLSMLVYEMVRMPIESIGFNEFYYPTVLLFLALGSAFAPLREAPGTARAPNVSLSGGDRYASSSPRS
jgi:exopolysaccharide production protein ExoQ